MFSNHWPRAIDLTIRSFSSTVTSRAACKLTSSILNADILSHSIVTETTRSLLSYANLNGPSTISDSSLEMWALVARKKAQLNPGSTQTSFKQICSWLREVWNSGMLSCLLLDIAGRWDRLNYLAGSLADRTKTATVALFARPMDLLNLFLACTNRPLSLPRLPQQTIPGIIAKTWFFFHENRDLHLFQEL